jgi:hypothetical protein
MKRLWWPTLTLLVACANNPAQPSPNPSPPPPPPAGPGFVVTYAPSKAEFTLPKNSSTKLTATVAIKSTKVQKVRFTFAPGVPGIGISPSPGFVNGSGTVEFTVTTLPGLSESNPYFAVNAEGLDKNGATDETYTTTFQWNAP